MRSPRFQDFLQVGISDRNGGLLGIGAASYYRSMAEKVPGWLERILLPQISGVKAEVKVEEQLKELRSKA